MFPSEAATMVNTYKGANCNVCHSVDVNSSLVLILKQPRFYSPWYVINLKKGLFGFSITSLVLIKEAG
jgi:hypothetical protein